MVRFFHARNLQSGRSFTAIILAFLFLAGLLCGAVTATFADTSYFLMMRRAATYPVSIVVLLPAIFLPLLFSAFAVYISQLWLLIPVVLSKAFTFGFLSCGIRASNPHSGWLIQFLFMFSDWFVLPILCWYWVRSCRTKRFERSPFIAAVVIISGITILDFLFISPFLAHLLS